MVVEVRELNSSKLVSWDCVDGLSEWIGTNIKFDLSEHDNQTILFLAMKTGLKKVSSCRIAT